MEPRSTTRDCICLIAEPGLSAEARQPRRLQPAGAGWGNSSRLAGTEGVPARWTPASRRPAREATVR